MKKLSEKEKQYIEHVVKPIQKKSKIWQLLRNKKLYGIDSGHDIILNGGMSTDGYDRPYAYLCTVFGYEITMYSKTRIITVFKKRWDKINNVNKLNLHYHYYVSDIDVSVCRIFENEYKEPIPKEKLASIANRNWKEYKKYIDSVPNNIFMQEMKYKYIRYMEHHKQILYDEEQKKYLPYDDVMYWSDKILTHEPDRQTAKEIRKA